MTGKPNALPARIAGVILAGGRSQRMGQDKAQILLQGETLLARAIAMLAPQVDHLAINANDMPEASVPAGIPVFPDHLSGFQGPLAGIHAAMLHARALHPPVERVATIAIDTPFLPLDLVARLASAAPDAGTIAIAASGGAIHPVAALWPVALADDLAHFLQADPKRRVRDFLLRHPMIAVDFAPIETALGPLDPFFNINKPEDLTEAGRFLDTLASAP